MFAFSTSRLLLNMIVSLFVSNAQLGILPFHLLFVIRSFSSRVSSNLNDHSFTVSFLINSCGLILKSAQSISKKICFKTLERPDSVLRLLREHGFTNSHISKIVKMRPRVLLLNPERTILPKLEFLCSIGVSRSDLSVIVSQNPDLLNRSIKRNLIPHYHILKSILVSDEKVIKCLKRLLKSSIVLSQNDFYANISLLRGLGIPQSSISLLVTFNPSTMCLKAFNFAEGVKKVVQIGFDPSKLQFVRALQVLLGIKQKTWEDKIEAFRRWGLSEEEISSIFRKNPFCMGLSEKNIMCSMNFLVCKMGWQPAAVARVPIVLSYGLETRIKPRCSVIRVLLLKGLIKADVPVSSVMITREKYFLGRFVIKYLDQVPQLLDIFQGKIGLTELGFGFDDKSVILD
ncbi:transcription termination factor MTERF5, chloroplastic-like [Hevea brasiliensis]|uniref:transcription termination factor MTERF5, chloroplastic-like n=1 Tax=Hevea brasiliensis TaxID=3981 RepID=UPI0025DD6655|nr:transcription termination factor MTERF5, chloroplastic-like [Hevea brasiliensis]